MCTRPACGPGSSTTTSPATPRPARLTARPPEPGGRRRRPTAVTVPALGQREAGMRLGSGVGRGTPEQIKARAQRLEAAGIDVLWVAELYGLDGVSLMGFLASVTERVQIGSSILTFYSRTP